MPNKMMIIFQINRHFSSW